MQDEEYKPKGDVNQILFYDEQIRKHNKTLDDMVKQYTTMVEEMALLEQRVALACLDYIHENEDGAKIARAKLEMIASSQSTQLRGEYPRLVYLRRRKKGAETAIAAVERSLSAIQSQMKFTKI